MVLRAEDPRVSELDAAGWRVSTRSFGARLDAERVDSARLAALIERVNALAAIRELGASDVDTILPLDVATLADYPGSVATRHLPLSRERALVTPTRRAFGAITPSEDLVAMTFIDLDGRRAETDFTVVAPRWRGRGLGTAVKAASVLALLETDGATARDTNTGANIRQFRTGGSADNPAIIAANAALGYVIDEHWLTLTPPAS